jgi:allantoinase
MNRPATQPETIRGRRVLMGGRLQPASIHVDANGRIAGIADYDAPAATGVTDVGDLILMAGVVDTHVHVNEPGRTAWEGFETATRAAAAGGITTIVDMPLNSIPATTTVAALEAKRGAARGRSQVDVACWGGVVPGCADDVLPLARAGVLGFKCFLAPSGVDEFPHVTALDLRSVAPRLVESGLPLLVHAELPDALDPTWSERADPRDYAAYLRSRPVGAEVRAIEQMVDLAREFGPRAPSSAVDVHDGAEATSASGAPVSAGLRVHIVHVSSADGVRAIRAARAEGLPISGETCPHYLTACDRDVESADRDGVPRTWWKCAPPIRSDADREALWSALADGVLSLVATDHSPSPPELKCGATGDFARAWGGIASLQLAVPIVWTGARARGYAVADVARWLAEGPAALAGLSQRKGRIAIGLDADLVAWDPDARFRVDPAALHHRHAVTPYAWQELRGRVAQTWVRGRCVYDRGAFPSPAAGDVL